MDQQKQTVWYRNFTTEPMIQEQVVANGNILSQTNRFIAGLNKLISHTSRIVFPMQKSICCFCDMHLDLDNRWFDDYRYILQLRTLATDYRKCFQVNISHIEFPPR